MRVIPRALTIACALLAFAGLPVAADAAITGTVYMDYNSNGANNAGGFVSGSSVTATDVGVAGVTVNAYDASGTRVGTTTTAADGTYTVCSTGCSGTVRLEFSVPSGYEPSFKGTNNGTSVRFVSASAANVDFAVTKPTQYCQDNPLLVTCMFPIADSQTALPTEAGGFTLSSAFTGASPLVMNRRGFTQPGGPSAVVPSAIASGRAIGATFGVGVDRSRNVFFGSYVKRHSEYALDGSGNPRTGLNIYRVNLGDTSVATTLTPWVTLGIATMPAHNPVNPAFVTAAGNFPYAADGNRSLTSGQTGYSAVFENVGRAGLGDVDVSPDGSRLYAIEMTQAAPKLWEVPITGSGASVTAGAPVDTPLTAPATFNGVPCRGQWHPMGIGLSGTDVYIGGVCGGENSPGVAGNISISHYSITSNVISVRTRYPHGLAAGDGVGIATLLTGSNGAQVVNTVTSATEFTYSSTASNTAGWVAAPANAFIQPNVGGKVISVSCSANVVTATTSVAHGLAVGDWIFVSAIQIAGVNVPEYNARAQVASAPTSTSVTYAKTCTDRGTSSTTAGNIRSESEPIAAFVQKRNGSGGFDTVAAIPLGYPKAPSNGSGVNWWWGGRTYDFSGSWHRWVDDIPPPANTNFSTGNATSGTDTGSFAQPMLANIEITDNGSLVLAMRDRYMDQVSPTETLNYERGTETLINQGQGAAEIIRLCPNGSGGYNRESGGDCGADSGAKQPDLVTGTTSDSIGPGNVLMTATMRNASPLYYWTGYADGGTGSHSYTSLGGAAMMPGSPVLWSTAYDISALIQQGVRAYGPCPTRGTDSGSCGPSPAADGAAIGGQAFRYSNASAKYSFKKGNGLGDLELVCDAAPLQIGNLVWIDANRNGIQDPGETPVAGVTLRLYDANNTVVGTAVTDIDGTYFFSSTVAEAAAGNGDNAGGGLTAGAAFTIRADNPADFAVGGPLAGYQLTQATQPSSGAGSVSTSVDSNAALVGSYPQISVGARSAGQNDHTFDVGFVSSPAVGMGDKVWVDANRNGVQDGGEAPLAGVTVALLNADGTPAMDAQGNPVATATTDGSGNYFIGNLLPGNYKAQFTLPSGYVFTSTGAGTSATDSNPTAGANPLIGTTPTFTISGSATGDTTTSTQPNASFANLTIDAGVVPIVGMGDYTWIDANQNGVQDNGEAPLAGVIVQLLNAAGSAPAIDAQGNPVGPVTTDANGRYFIGNLLPGDFKAQFTLPSGYTFTSTGAGTSATDSNPTAGANPLVGVTPTFSIAGSATGDTVASTAATARFENPTIDAGVVPLVGMGDYTWIDANQNGVQDAGEAPLPGVIVQLMNATGTAVATDAQGNPVPAVTTDASGRYFIGGLLPGSYSAKFTLPSGYAFTSSGAGTSATDSNPSIAVNANTKRTPSFTIAGGASGDTTAVTQPNAMFANLTVDAGVVPLVGMGDRTWVDANANGIQDPGELPLAGVIVTLLNAAGTGPATDAQGNPVAPVTTAADGSYFIGGLLPGTYRAQFDLPTGYQFTSTGNGTSATDSNPSPTAQPLVGVTPAFTIAGSATGDTTAVSQPGARFANLTIDAGVITSGSSYVGGPVGMGNFTWIDADGDGTQDVGEAPLAGVVVTLLTTTGQPAVDYQGNPVPSVTTDANGAYFIGNLAPGTYKAQFALPGGYMFTTPTVGSGTAANDSNPTAGPNPLIGTTPNFTIASSATGETTAVSGNPTANFANLTIDAGVVPVVGMGDFTWVDANGNGQQDAGEQPLAGVIVQLLDATGSAPATDAQGVVVSPVTTDADGRYFVGNLLPGTYKAQFTLPSGYIFTTPTTGAATTDSNPSPLAGSPQIGVTPAFPIAASATGLTTAVTRPNASFANLTIDAGVVPVVGMGDYTWIDANENGIQDAGEAPLPGVIVQLLDAAGTAVATDAQGVAVPPVVTDASGAYFIGNLLPGTYRARFTIPSGYTFTTPTAGAAGSDSNPTPGANPLIGTTPAFAIAGSATGDTTAVTGRWRASYANLTIDAGVVPVPTQSGGGSGGGGGSTGGGDSGGGASTGGTASSAPATPTPRPLNGRGPNGTNTNGVSGGPGSRNPVPGANSGALVGVGDLVWFDTNRNGVQDPGERPMRGARVVILNADGTRARNAEGKVIPAQTTDARGRYFFANLQPGRYMMRFIFPSAAYVPTEPGQGAKAQGSNANPTRTANVAQTGIFVVAGIAYGETDREAAKGQQKASLANPSIDAGVIPPWALPAASASTVTG